MEVLEEHIAEVVARHTGRPEMALVALQEIQSLAGYISGMALNSLAKALGVPDGELQGVISFYSHLRTTPPGKHSICVCNGDSCVATGSQRIMDAVETLLGMAPGQTTPDGQFTYEKVYCVGNCALSPAITIDGQVHGHCKPEAVVRQLKRLQGISNG